MRMCPACKEVKRTVPEIFWEKHMLTILRAYSRSSISAGMTFPPGVTVLVGCLYFLPLPFNTLKRYRKWLQKSLLFWCTCSDCSSNSSDSPRKAADKENVGNSHLWVLFLISREHSPLETALWQQGRRVTYVWTYVTAPRGNVHANIWHCPPGAY